MEDPGIERKAERSKSCHAGAKIRPQVKSRTGTHGAVADDGIGIPGSAMPHAAKATAAGSDLGLEHGGYAIAEREIGKAHDAGAYPCRTVLSAVAHGSDAGTEFDFAYRPHLDRPGGAVHRMAFVEHGCDYLVSRPEIGQQVGQQIAIAPHVPQVMVRVDDGEVGLEDRLRRRLGQPRLVGPEDPAELRRL